MLIAPTTHPLLYVPQLYHLLHKIFTTILLIAFSIFVFAILFIFIAIIFRLAINYVPGVDVYVSKIYTICVQIYKYISSK